MLQEHSEDGSQSPQQLGEPQAIIEAELRAEELKEPLKHFENEIKSTVDDVKSGVDDLKSGVDSLKDINPITGDKASRSG